MRVLEDQVLRLHVAPVGRRVLHVLLCFVVVGCASHESRPTRQPALDEISALFEQIRAWRREACLSPEPREDQVGFARPARRSIGAVCPGDVNPNNELCSLADATCDNADAICARADELGDHRWAHDKCMSASSSCRETQKLCCASMHAPVALATDCTATDSTTIGYR